MSEDSPRFVVDDAAELNALMRTIMEAKFCGEPSDTLVSWSPIVADMANRVADALSRVPRRVPLADPNAWRNPKNHPEKVAAVRARILANDAWDGWSDEERADQVRVLLAPLEPDEGFIRELVGLDRSTE